MSMVGADAPELDRLATQFESARATLERAAASLTSTLTSSPWRGGDADTFRSDWSRSHRRSLSQVADSLSTAAQLLRGHAQQQRDASSGAIAGPTRPPGSDGGNPSGRIPPPCVELPGNWKWERSDDPLYRKGNGDADAIDPEDVVQRGLNDCFVLANLKAIARANPELIRQMIHDNGDGTYTITFHDVDGSERKITVNDEFPTQVKPFERDDRTPFAQRGDGELWVRLIQKAYAEEFRGGYGGIGKGGQTAAALAQLTGLPVNTAIPADLDDSAYRNLAADIDAGRVAASTGTFYDTKYVCNDPKWFDEKNITSSHAYAIERIDPATRTVHLDNPVGRDDLVLSYEDYERAFTRLQFVEVAPKVDMIDTPPRYA